MDEIKILTFWDVVNDETMQQLYDKLTRKCRTEFHGQRVGPGWIKYYWNDTVWNLEDGITPDHVSFVTQSYSGPRCRQRLHDLRVAPEIALEFRSK
jgi:hypothetical protein